jgi:hypothetical protein
MAPRVIKKVDSRLFSIEAIPKKRTKVHAMDKEIKRIITRRMMSEYLDIQYLKYRHQPMNLHLVSEYLYTK